MKIQVYNRQKDLPLNKSSVIKLIRATLEYLGTSCSEVAVYFVSEKKICELHEQFFQDPSPTDCISFPMDEVHLGEIFVCPSAAIVYGKKKDVDVYEETALYVIHGLLHLLGFDDLEERARRIMRKKEKSCMRHLRTLKISIRPARK